MRRVNSSLSSDDHLLEDLETEGERQLKSLLHHQLDTAVSIEQCVSKRRCFAPAALYKPFGEEAAGTLTLTQFQALQESEQETASLRELGLSDSEILLWKNHGSTDKGSGLGAAPEAMKERLQAIQEKITERQRILSLPQRFAGSKQLSRREMEIENALFQGTDRHSFLRALYHQDEAQKKTVNEKDPMSHLETVCQEMLSKPLPRESQSTKSDLCLPCFPAPNESVVKDTTQLPDQGKQTEQYGGPSFPAMKRTGSVAQQPSLGPLTVKEPVEFIPEEEILKNRLSEEEIRSISRFCSYRPGKPSKVLYLKNLSPRVTVRELVSLFARFQEKDGPPIQFRLLSGRMRGQAFITFPNNASDPGVTAKLLCIDVVEIKGELCLTFTDNGAGMTPHKLHRMLSFGFTDKAMKKNHPSIGVYGNGFKSGSMRLGKDAIVFTKNGGALSVGLLSQTYLERVHAQAVIVPVIPFNQQNKKMIVTDDSGPSLEAILKHTLFTTEEELLAQFDAIPGKKGTRILIWNIRRNKDGKPELDFDTDKYDIRISDFSTEESENAGRKILPCLEKVQESSAPETEYSLRAYCSILYLKPRMQIVLRQKKVKTQLISKSLASIEYDVYRPTSTNKRVKIIFGFNCKNSSHFGIMMYHNNRLIKSYEKVGCQMKGDGMGVIGVIECNFLKPAHNKQDFEESKEYRRTITALGQKLNTYWKMKVAQMNLDSLNAAHMIAGRPDQTWVQCEECLKWRKLPNKVDPASLPEKWFCHLHPHPKYKSCSAPEEQEPSDEEMSPSYDRKSRKEEQIAERKRRRLSSPLENLEPQILSTTPEPCAAQNNSVTCVVKQQPEEEGPDRIAGSLTPPPPLDKISAVYLTTGPLEQNIPQTASKCKLSSEEELLEKQRQYQEQIEPSPPDLTSPSPPPSLDRESSTEADEGQECSESDKDDQNVEGSINSCLVREHLDAPNGTNQAQDASCSGGLCPTKETPASPGQLEGEQKEMAVVQAELEEKMPALIAESQAAVKNVCVNTCGNVEEVDKRPFVAVVGISKAAVDGEAPIQLIPFGWEERLDKAKVEEKAQSHNDHPLDGEKGGGDLQIPETTDQRDTVEQEELRRTVENISVELKSISAERDLLQGKVEELEQEKSHLETDFLKSQQELATLRAQETEGLYWSKKHMGYRQAELQKLKAQLERTIEEKTELKERLKETEMHLEVLREAHVSCRSPERGDLKSALEKLKNLRMNVSQLLSLVLPHLELQDVNYESDQVDEILQTVLETNRMSE
ncbi:MORC family CW-type zinc finger protein 4-like [Emydura macquarii macquarii]|uniref:MORC family CW-type zinc finger protein 4-like n=1 Tax=Emydura macquarii macquarii TaxID=1129001 RepID=UPI00352B8385